MEYLMRKSATANVFMNMLVLPQAKSEDKEGEQDQEQKASPQDDLDVKQSTLCAVLLLLFWSFFIEGESDLSSNRTVKYGIIWKPIC